MQRPSWIVAIWYPALLQQVPHSLGNPEAASTLTSTLALPLIDSVDAAARAALAALR